MRVSIVMKAAFAILACVLAVGFCLLDLLKGGELELPENDYLDEQ